MTKNKLEKKYGKCIGEIDNDNDYIYGAGAYTTSYFKCAKFFCVMDPDNRITALLIQNYLD